MSATALLSVAAAPMSASKLASRSRGASIKGRVFAPGSAVRRFRGGAAPLRVVARGLEADSKAFHSSTPLNVSTSCNLEGHVGWFQWVVSNKNGAC
jgi:hypothetical protein